MKHRCLAALLFVTALAGQQWQVAKPGYRYEFPRDHFSHPHFQTEWWYYTGNLRAGDGHRFGFELTFFRQAQHLMPQQMAASDAVWQPDQIYVAHLALSDIDGQQFFHMERLNRAGPGLAGAGLIDRKYWNGNWEAKWISLEMGEQELQAVCDNLTLNIRIQPEKPLVIHGENGISIKGPLPGEASHYLSFTRLNAMGKLRWKNRDFDVTGLAWMDHEFFSETADNDLAGWDWFAIQLDNHEELMLYRLRNKSGNSRYSSGTFVDTNGHAQYLDASEFDIKPAATWHSRDSGATYPISWNISVPSLGLDLTERTVLADQELFDAKRLTPTYWEGAVSYDGTLRDIKVHGAGYLEMTGYANRSPAAVLP
ncbi:MAG TPA: lipocalin-like domain-containing protein [Bryobacteraceae bacterium]|nr:lipocalin-like domain-containing protein [Bryobacteraceae bacterium]